MSIFKCKMCGGALEISNNETIVECAYCGTMQTLPKLDDERKANLYDRANHFRRNNEFDKAMGIYEQILNEDQTDAETYWSLVLCHYGIEYVEDPTSHKRIPTVNRAQFTSVLADENYKSALQYADAYQRSIYEAEAKAIDEIQKGILAISQKEEPFDVFICYKESDAAGRRTPDSVLANDLYHQLTQEGFKVFFARITLEDKLGSAYEPYIFAALNSAKVMVVLGTKPEYFNAVWVKNEWSRYLSLIKQGQKKMLIPAYKDIDPYDLPEEFSHLQAQDMSKLGFMQDLIRGIKKIAQADAPKATVIKETVVTGGNTNTAPLLKRAFMFLDDKDWESADEYCEKVLDIDPENAQAYLGKLMADSYARTKEELKDCSKPFDNNNNYKKALRFADDELKNELTGYVKYINERNELARLEKLYNQANIRFSKASTEEQFKEAANHFLCIENYKDSADLAKKCLEAAENAKQEAIANEKNSILNKANLQVAKAVADEEQLKRMYSPTMARARANFIAGIIADYEGAKDLFDSIPDWKDACEKAETCKAKLEELKGLSEENQLEVERQDEIARQETEAQKKRNTKKRIISTAIAFIVLAIILVTKFLIIPPIKYNKAVKLMENQQVTESYRIFQELGDYKDAAEKAAYLKNQNEISYALVQDTVKYGVYEQDNNLSNGKEEIEWIVLDKTEDKALLLSKYALDCKPYNTTEKYVTWEDCTLREWLNNDFINVAFTEEEKASIPGVTLEETEDKVFLLSVSEIEKYFDYQSDSILMVGITKGTDYAFANGAYDADAGDVGWRCDANDQFDNLTICDWWSRTLGEDATKSLIESDKAIYFESYQGEVGDGCRVDASDKGVRPAIWVSLGE